jgi:hypothetical protein
VEARQGQVHDEVGRAGGLRARRKDPPGDRRPHRSSHGAGRGAAARQEGKITLLDPASAGGATALTIVLTAPDTRPTGSEDQPSALLASWSLPTRGTVWIVGTHGHWDGFRAAVMAALPQIRDQLKDGISDTVLPGKRNERRAVLWTDVDGAGVAHMIEVGVEYGRR